MQWNNKKSISSTNYASRVCTVNRYALTRAALSAVIACCFIPLSANAAFISLNSIYGNDSITLDTDTGLEWIDPWIPTGGSFHSYNYVMDELAPGGEFEGFRYATLAEVEVLLYSSAGFDPATSQPRSEQNIDNWIAAAHLMSFFGTTWGQYYDEYDYDQILDAVFYSEDADRPGSLYFGMGRKGDEYYGGNIRYGTPRLEHLENNSNPYGHFLVRATSFPVPEPTGLSFFLLAMVATLFSRYRMLLA